MAKLSKAQRKAHAEAEAILTKDRLTDDEKEFVFNNWHEGAGSCMDTPICASWNLDNLDVRSGAVMYQACFAAFT